MRRILYLVGIAVAVAERCMCIVKGLPQQQAFAALPYLLQS